MDLAHSLSRLIQAESYPGREETAVRVLVGLLEGLGLKAEVDEAGNVEAVVGSREPEILLTGHIDVVPAGDPGAWPHPPFAGVIEGGKVWGRGAVDMKGPLVAMLGALERLKGRPLAGRVRFLATVQEEVGGLGSRYASSRLKQAPPKAILLGEPSAGRLMRGHRGRGEIWADFPGEQAHAALASGANPIYPLTLFLSQLEQRAESFDIRLTPTRLETYPEATNVVPGVARVVLDLRYEPGADIRELLDGLRDMAGEASVYIPEEERLSGAVRLRISALLPAYSLPSDHPLLEAALRTLGQDRADFWAFTTDAPYLAWSGAPVIGYGPGDPTLAHTTFEHIGIGELEAAAQAYVDLVQALLQA
jgi:acetylornithine deacetylase/succinyl-diaminopimelate desuccinylase-like protein